jgi:hypothetical protein
MLKLELKRECPVDVVEPGLTEEIGKVYKMEADLCPVDAEFFDVVCPRVAPLER